MPEVITTSYPGTVSMTHKDYKNFQSKGVDRLVFDIDHKVKLGVLKAGTVGEKKYRYGQSFMVLKFDKY